jgi:hypothetical protein
MIENTSNRDPLLHYLGMLDGTDGYITGMESAGQAQLVHSTDLPTKGSDDPQFLALGFTFGDPHENDPMFRPATLPEGWSKQGSDHAMWSYIIDPFGRRRVSVFYKAAFYDRKASMRLDSVHTYVAHHMYEGTTPILDNSWATPEAVTEAARDLIVQANEAIELYTRPGNDDKYGRERIAESRQHVDWAEALIKSAAGFHATSVATALLES